MTTSRKYNAITNMHYSTYAMYGATTAITVNNVAGYQVDKFDKRFGTQQIHIVDANGSTVFSLPMRSNQKLT